MSKRQVLQPVLQMKAISSGTALHHGDYAPIMLPVLNCLIAPGFIRPWRVIGAAASFWYWEMDQSFGLMADGEASNSIGRRCAWRVRRAAEKPMLPPRMSGVRRE